MIGNTTTFQFPCDFAQMCQPTIILIYRKYYTCIVIFFTYQAVKIACSSLNYRSYCGKVIHFLFFSSDDKARVVYQFKLATYLSATHLIKPCLHFCHKGFCFVNISLAVPYKKTVVNEHCQAEGSQYITIVKHPLVF